MDSHQPLARMLATHSPFTPMPAASRAHEAYRDVDVNARVSMASPHQLVTMLFDGLREALAQGRGAIRNGQIERKGRSIGRAVRIVEEGLKAGLDLQGGGSLARDLHDLYAYLSLRLTRANLDNDEAALDECQRLVEPLASAWAAIGARAANASL